MYVETDRFKLTSQRSLVTDIWWEKLELILYHDRLTTFPIIFEVVRISLSQGEVVKMWSFLNIEEI